MYRYTSRMCVCVSESERVSESEWGTDSEWERQLMNVFVYALNFLNASSRTLLFSTLIFCRIIASRMLHD